MANLDAIFLALSDPTRRAVLERLGTGPAAVSDLARPHAMALPSFMKHVTLLERAGLIATSKSGRVRTCRLAPDGVRAAETWLAVQRSTWEERLDRLDAFLAEEPEKGDTK